MAKRVRKAPESESEDYRLDPSLDFMRLLWSIEHRLQSASKRMESSIGITGPQRLALRIITKFPDLPAKKLARILHLHPSTISGVLQRLVGKGLLVRQDDPTDRRRVRLRVKGSSKPFTRRTNGTIESAVERALGKVSRDHLQRAREVLWAIAVELEDV